MEKHLEFFRSTGMDFVKIQFELPSRATEISGRKIGPRCRSMEEFYQPRSDVVEGLVREPGGEALVILTLYSPLMWRGRRSRQRSRRISVKTPGSQTRD